MKTCSKESAQRLVELGVRREAYFSHMRFTHDFWRVCKDAPTNITGAIDMLPAWTACELGEMFPEKFGDKFAAFEFCYGEKVELDLVCTAMSHNISQHYECADTMPEAMALMLIWLLENTHIRVEDINDQG